MSGAMESIIVGMGFDNRAFESGVKLSLGTLSLLKSQLNFGGQKNGLDDIAASAGRFNLNPVGVAIDGISAKFGALATVGITTLSNITNKAVDAGVNLAKSLTVSPISSGLEEYETNMNSVQTILANTESSGATLQDVQDHLDTLNKYSDDTIYNFSEMAKNIGTFTAAGVNLDTSTQSIKGIANIAALSGSNSQQASTAMYQLSQAISAGKVGLQDWNSVVNAGMGGTVFQRALSQTAEKMGTLSSGAVQLTGDMKNVSINGESFRESIMAGPGKDSWLTSDVLTATLKQFTGDMTDAELAAQGFNDEEIKAIQQQAKTAKGAATEVKTFTALIDTLKEGVGSGWSESWRTIIGDFGQAKVLWTAVSNTIGGMIKKSSDARNALLKGWADGLGRGIGIDAIRLSFNGLLSIIKPIQEAFRSIFPPTTAADLIHLTASFHKFAEKIAISGETADKIKRIFAGVFSIFHIGIEAVKGLFSGLGQLFGSMSKGSGGLLTFAARIGDWLVHINEAVTKGEIFKKFFTTIATFIEAPIAVLRNFGTAISEMVGNIGGFSANLGGVTAVLGAIGSAISQFWNILAKGDFVSGVFAEDSPVIDWFFKLRDAAEKFFSADSIKMMLGIGGGAGLAIGGGLGIKAVIEKMFGGGDDGIIATMKNTVKSIGDSFDSIKGVFDGLTGALTTMQTNLKASILLKIAIAVGLLAVSILLISTIDAGDLVKSLGAIVVAFTLLLGAMAILTKMSSSGGFTQMPAIALGMIGMAAAILILATAAKVIATMSWEELAKGLGGLVIMMGIVVAGAWGLSKVQGIMLRAAIAMIPFALGIRLLVMSVQALGEMDWAVMLRGMGGLAGVIVAVGLGLKLMPKNMVSIGTGLLLVSAAMLILTKSISSLGAMDVEVLRQGLIGIGAALGIIAVALQLMPKDSIAMAAGLMIVSVALLAISKVVQDFGGMSWPDMIKGLVGLAASLAILAVSLSLMSGTIAGSAALAIAAVALALLLPSILALSNLSWGDLIKGMVGLAGVFTILGVASLVLGIISPLVMALAVALVLMGAGLLAIGLGALAFSAALTAIAKVSELGHDALIKMADVIPMMAAAFAQGVISFATTLADGATQLAEAVGELVIAMLEEFKAIIPRIKDVLLALLDMVTQIIIEGAPKIGAAFTAIIQAFLDVLTTNAPLIWDKVYEMMMGFLDRIRDRIPEVADIVVAIIEQFLKTLADSIDRVVRAGMDFIATFLENLASAIRDNSERITNAAQDVGRAIVEGIIKGIKNGLGDVVQAAKDMAGSALQAAKDALWSHSPSRKFIEVGEDIDAGLVIGINNGLGAVLDTIGSLVGKSINAAAKSIGKELKPVLKSLFDTLRTGAADIKFYGYNSPLGNQMQQFHKDLQALDLQLAAFYGRVNMADPASIEAYTKAAGDNLIYLEGLLTGIEAAADSAFDKLEAGVSLNRLLDDGDVLKGLFNAVTSIIPGPEAAIVRVVVGIIDSIFGVIFGKDNTLFGLIGQAIDWVITKIAGFFGIKFPDKVDEDDPNKKLENFLINVTEAQGRFEKLSKTAIQELVGTVNEANKAVDSIQDTSPKVTPVLELDQFNKDKAAMLSDMSTDVSAQKASSISASQQSATEGSASSSAPVTNINLTQNNTSPVALDHVEIYKQTKGQMSMAKEALSIS